MKNLKNLNLVELNIQEVKKIEGGNKVIDFVAGYLAGKALDYVISNYPRDSAYYRSGGVMLG